jgi:hypothetical protein
MQGLGTDFVRERHGAFDVDEEHRHELALAFECGSRGQELVAEVARRVVARYSTERGTGLVWRCAAIA